MFYLKTNKNRKVKKLKIFLKKLDDRLSSIVVIKREVESIQNTFIRLKNKGDKKCRIVYSMGRVWSCRVRIM